jgi:hypothetical protein
LLAAAAARWQWVGKINPWNPESEKKSCKPEKNAGQSHHPHRKALSVPQMTQTLGVVQDFF